MPRPDLRTVATFGLWLVLSVPMAVQSPVTAGPSTLSEVDKFIEEMVEKHGFDRRELKDILGHARVRSGVIRAMTRSAEAVLWDEYRSRFVDASRVQGGVKFWNVHAQALVFA